MTYILENIELFWDHLDRYERIILVTQFVVTFFVLVLSAIALVQCFRLRKRVQALQRSVQNLINAEQMRFLRELRAEPKIGTPVESRLP